MLSYTEFIEFVRPLRDEPVLTVYISGICHDPSARAAWRVQLDHALDAAREGLVNAIQDERQRFERCVQLLEGELAALPSMHVAPGWVAFVTSDKVQRAESLPVEVPTQVVWSVGPYVTPYVRAIVEDQRGIVAVADAREVTLYEYRSGTITRQHVVHAEAHLHPPLHMGDTPRQGFHPGVRGETGREAAQRARGEGTERMLRKVADHMVQLAGGDGWILIGGIPEVGSHLAHHLPQTVLDRVVSLASLDVHASQAVILEVARREIAVIRNATAAQQAAQLVATGGHNGRVSIDPEVIQQALEQSRVHELYLTDHYLGNPSSEDAEAALRMALSQRAHIHVITGPAGRALDDSGGVVAQLRYDVPRAVRGMESAALSIDHS